MITKRYSPSKLLLPYLDAYWSIRNDSAKTIKFPVVPDGCMDIIYKQTDEQTIVLVGAMDKGIIVSLAPNDYYFGIRFKPAMLSFWMKENMSKFSNQILPLEDISQTIYAKLNIDTNNEEQKVELLNTLFEEEFLNIECDNRVLKAVTSIINFKADIPVQTLSERTKLSSRQLERLFLSHLGYSVKRFISVIRFYNAHQNIVENGTDNLTQLAHNSGYYDQPHFNKEYKKFTNFSPKDSNMSLLYKTKL